MRLRGFAVGVLFAWAPASSHPPPWLAPMLEPVAGPPTPALHAIHGRPSPTKPKPRRRLAPRLVAVGAALRQLGVPYRWGGETPRGGFDCSGLISYAWARAGVRLPRTTWDQIRVGVRIRGVKWLLPGDLMFPSRGHVQMFIGRGKTVEAARTGTRVRIKPVRGYYIAIRRPVPAH